MKIVDDSRPASPRSTGRIPISAARCRGRTCARLTQGRAQFVSDVALPRMAHVAFVRSPHAHARIKRIDTAAAKKAPGVIAVVTGAELAKVITPWVGVLTHLKGIKSAPQHAIAVDRACWQGEAVCAVVARTRAEAEDALRAGRRSTTRSCRPSPMRRPRSIPTTPVIHPELGDNLTLRARARRRRSRQGLRRGRRGGRDDLRVRPPHRRHATSRAPSSPTGIPASSA